MDRKETTINKLECKGCSGHRRKQMRIHKKIVDMNCGAEKVCKQFNNEPGRRRRKPSRNRPKWDSEVFLPEEEWDGY